MRTLMGYTSKFLIFIFISVLTAGCATTNSLEAGKAFERGDYNTAIKYYKLCVDKEGDTGKFASHYSFLLGKSYFDKGQYPEAITYLKRAIDIYKKGMYVFQLDPAWYFWLGRAYYENQQYREAIVYFDQAGAAAPKDPAMILPDYKKFIPPRSTCYSWLGYAYYQDKQYEQAINAYQKAIDLDPKAPDFYTMLGSAYGKMKQFDKAIAAINRAIQIKPSFFPYAMLGNVYEEQGKLKEAIDAWKKAIEFEPKKIDPYSSLFNLYMKLEDYANSIAILQKAQGLAPDNYNIPYFIGDAYARLGRFDEAISSLSKAISLSTFTGIGMQFAIAENFPVVKGLMEGPAKKAGIEKGDRIIKINGQSTKGWDSKKVSQAMKGAEGTQVVLTIEREGLNKPIEKTITREIIIEKSAAPVFGKRSFAYRLKGNTDDADKDAKQAYSLDPNDNWAKTAMSVAYIDKGKYDDAIKMLSTIQSDGSFARLLEAAAYAKSGDMKRAVEIYSSIPEDFLSGKDAFIQSCRNALFISFKPYINAQKVQAMSLIKTKGQYKEALNAYVEVLKVADVNEAKVIRNDIAKLIKNYPYIAELPEEARRHAMRAEVSTKEGKFDDAVKEYKEAIKIAPYFPALYKAIALNYAELKQYRKAINNLNIYLELSTDTPDARAAKDQIYQWEFMLEKEGK